jgi:hypothetical protein
MRTFSMLMIGLCAPCFAQEVSPPPGIPAAAWSQIASEIREAYGPIIEVRQYRTPVEGCSNSTQGRCGSVVIAGRPGKCQRLRLQEESDVWRIVALGEPFACF